MSDIVEADNNRLKVANMRLETEIERLKAALRKIAKQKSAFGMPTDAADIARAVLEGK